MMKQSLASGRYELLRKLGSGGMGVVYEALDRETDTHVAIKTLRDFSADLLFRLKHEFRELADIQHPNLIHFGELYCDADQWFFTMELVRGCDFLTYVRLPAVPLPDEGPTLPVVIPNGPAESFAAAARPAATERDHARGYDEARLRAAARQLAQAIHALHRTGSVHRDIKPSNVMVRDDGHVVLLDFGLMEKVGVDTGALCGTPNFIAPEQIDERKVGPEADWYAFGCVLFLALTGALPFVGPPPVVVEAKRTRPAPAPHSLVSDVPPDLDALCQALLAREPAERPRGDAVLRALEADDDASATADETSSNLSATFVGRGAELAELVDAYRRVQAGTRELVIVEGEPGVGKSLLVRRFLERHVALDPAAVVLAGRCYEQEEVPFKAFDSVIDALAAYLNALDETEALPLLGFDLRHLGTLFPVLRLVPAVAAQEPLGAQENPLALRERAFQELARLLTALSERLHLVLFIDDLQWADQDSLDLLAHLLAPDGPPCMLLATRRLAPAGDPASVSAPTARDVSRRHIRLGGLSRDEAAALVARLGRDGDGGPLALDDVDRMLSEAAGHPLFLSELARSRRQPSRDQRPGASSLQAVLWQRVSELDETARRFMECVALAGAPVKFQVLARAAGLDVGGALQLMSALRVTHLIRVTRRGNARLVEPYHDRLREAIVSRGAGDDRERAGAHERGDVGRLALHLSIGRSLLADTPADALDDALFTIVSHLQRGVALIDSTAERRQLLALILRAARKAKLATAFAAALKHVTDGAPTLAALADADDLRFAFAKERIELYYLLGQVDAANAAFTTALVRARDDGERTELYALRMTVQRLRGEFRDAIDSARAGLQALGVALPAAPGKLSIVKELALLRLRQGRRTLAELAELPISNDPRTRCAMQLLTALAPAAYMVDRTLLSFVLLKVASLSLEHGMAAESAYGFVGYGMVMTGGFQRYRMGFELGELAIQLNERFGGGDLEAKVLYMSGAFLIPWVRPFAQAELRLRRAYDASVRLGDRTYRLFVLGNLAMMLELSAPNLDELLQVARTAAELARQERDVDLSAANALRLGLYESLRQPLGPATRSFRLPDRSEAELRASLSDEHTPLALATYFGGKAIIGYYFGDYAAAYRNMLEADRRERSVFASLAQVKRTFFRVLIAAQRLTDGATNERRRLQRWLTDGVAQLRRWAAECPENFAARHRLAQAEAARVAGRAVAAAAGYQAAVLVARRSGAVDVEALALELAARHATAQGEPHTAADCRRDAIAAYERWGARAKVEQLRGGGTTAPARPAS